MASQHRIGADAARQQVVLPAVPCADQILALETPHASDVGQPRSGGKAQPDPAGKQERARAAAAASRNVAQRRDRPGHDRDRELGREHQRQEDSTSHDAPAVARLRREQGLESQGKRR